LLDLTRLVSRLGRGPMTGVDRVEHAYLTHLLALETPLFGLVRTAAGYLLLDRAGARGVAALATRGPVGPSDLLSRLTNRDPVRARAEASVRRLAVGRALRGSLARLLRHLPDGASYLNTGHANLPDRGLAALHRRMRIAVLVHDCIPLDHPELSRPDTLAGFAAKLAAVSAHADLVIHTTQDARSRTEAHLRRMGRCPAGVVAGLGVPQPRPAALPKGVDGSHGYFVTIGTIEPRKNHALLLDVWDTLAKSGQPPPPLYVVGARGWADPALFDRLATTPGVTVLQGLPDGAVAALVQHAAALLFPSRAEGYGMPPVEAAALGTPVIASDLAVIREVMGDYPVYLDPTDSYSWLETIKGWGPGADHANVGTVRQPPRWQDHFNIVLSLV